MERGHWFRFHKEYASSVPGPGRGGEEKRRENKAEGGGHKLYVKKTNRIT